LPFNWFRDHSYILHIGAWRSLAARLLWEQEVGGSNPLAPTSLRFKTKLNKRSQKHPPHIKLKIWRIKTAIAFNDRQEALDFEAYLKSPSGRAFAK
jgi:hypothetical protein